MTAPRGISSADRRAAWDAYRRLNARPVHARMRREHECLVGAVYWNPQQVPTSTLRREMRRIRRTGFTFVRFHDVEPVEDDRGRMDFSEPDRWVAAAVEAGLKVFFHFHMTRAGRQALAKSGLSAEDAARRGLSDPAVAGAVRSRMSAIVNHYRRQKALSCWIIGGEPHATPIPLSGDLDRERFAAWLRSRYGRPAAVHAAWSIYPDRAVPLVASWDDALRVAGAIRMDEGLMLATTGAKHEAYGAMRDLVRFRADGMLEDHRIAAAMLRELDPVRPVYLGNHQLFINNAQVGWDIPASGRIGDVHFSSIHLSWHFEPFEGEVDRPVYMQSRATRDANKGGVTSAYETTGGPVQYSGGYGNHMDAGLMRRLMFSYLAAGNEIIAFWDWICRPGGIEAGEYGLVTLGGRVSEWAREAGRVAGAMARYGAELWNGGEEPELAIFRSWDSEAITMLEPRRFETETGPRDYSRGCAQQHLRALIGAGRAAMNHQVAYEYLYEGEILEGIAGVYPAIYLPHLRACSRRLLEALLAYVRRGGRLIADVQFAFHDPWGKLQPRGPNALATRLFGAWVDSIHDARTRPQSVDGMACEGFYGDIELAGARVLKRFADGRPAVTEANIGRGQGILVGFDAARQCWKPGQAPTEALLADLYRGESPRRWWTDAPLAFRRSHPRADHWFFINDGPARSATLRVYDRTYGAGCDAVSGRRVDTAGTVSVELPAYSGAWLRMERA